MQYDDDSWAFGEHVAESDRDRKSAAEKVTERLRQDEAERYLQVPEIVVSTDQAGTVDKAEAALHALGLIYVRGMTLVQVVRDHAGLSWLNSPSGTPFVMPAMPERLRELIGTAAVWRKVDKRSNTLELTMVPAWVPPTLMQRGQWKFPPLEGVTDTPVLRPDGTIHDRPGYDFKTGMLYDPRGVLWPMIDEAPSIDDARAALEALVEPFSDVPFVADSDRYATIALILSILGRSAIPGCVPMFAIGATTPGSGKGLTGDTAITIGIGHAAPKMPGVRDNDEMRKRLFSLALSAPAVVMFDNISGEFASEALEAALTATTIQDRVLGASKDCSVPLRTVFTMTGNNVELGGDLPRRVVPIDIDPRVENPEDRDGFRHPDLLGYVRAERPRLATAALTLLRAFVVAGRPAHGKAVKGSYEDWDRLVRGAIIWAGGADPLGGVERMRKRGSVDSNELRVLLATWKNAFGPVSVTASTALDKAGAKGELFDAIAAYGRGKPVDARLLGSRLNKLRGRIVDGLCFHDDGVAHGGAKLWKVGGP